MLANVATRLLQRLSQISSAKLSINIVKTLCVSWASFSCVGDLVPVLAVSVALSEMVSPGVGQTLPEHLVAGSHPSLGGEGRTTLQNIVQHVGHVALLRLVSGLNRPVLKKCWRVVTSSPVTALGLHPWF